MLVLTGSCTISGVSPAPALVLSELARSRPWTKVLANLVPLEKISDHCPSRASVLGSRQMTLRCR